MAGFKDYKGTKFTPYILPIIPAGAKLAAEGTSLDQDRIGFEKGGHRPSTSCRRAAGASVP
jgi:hypothetical protein